MLQQFDPRARCRATPRPNHPAGMSHAWVQAIAGEAMKPAAGLGGIWQRYVFPTADNGGMIFGIGELAAGTAMGPNRHDLPEVFYILSGEGEVRWRVDGGSWSSAPLRPGFAYHKTGLIEHEFISHGPEPLRGIYFKIDGPGR